MSNNKVLYHMAFTNQNSLTLLTLFDQILSSRVLSIDNGIKEIRLIFKKIYKPYNINIKFCLFENQPITCQKRTIRVDMEAISY